MAVCTGIKLLNNILLTFLLLVLFKEGDCSNSKPFVRRNNSLTHISILKRSDDLMAVGVDNLFREDADDLFEVGDNNSSCEHIYQDYLHMIDNFTRCELQYASPFKLCLNCTELYEGAKAVYANLTEEPKYVYCKVKYMESDRVQIIPTMQANMDVIWNNAHCQNCYSYDPNGLESRKVNYRPDVTKFLELYMNFSNCINITGEEDGSDLWTNDGNTSSKCETCVRNYTLLNVHYNSIYSHDSGDVCMDIMARMNNSRILWSSRLKCNHREDGRDAVPVIIISCFVACTPVLFYVSLKVTGKVGRKRIFKQKRLVGSQGTSGDSPATRSDNTFSKRRHTTVD